jgi:hypothetical protein
MPLIIVLRQVRGAYGTARVDPSLIWLRLLNNDTPSQLSSLYDNIAPAAASLKATRKVVPCT